MSIRENVHRLITENPERLPADIAAELAVDEIEVIRHLPENMVTLLDGSLFETVVKDIKDWGDILTVIDVDGSIFELKGSFPKGGMKYGYYNLSDRRTPLKGHLKPDAISLIALVSKPFHGVDTRSVQFFSHSGRCVFKVYLSRNEQKQILPEQQERFEALAQLASQQAA